MQVSQILIWLANTTIPNGEVYVEGQTPAAPLTVAGDAAKSGLLALGWTVTND
jgi:hypothetical protein